MAFEAGRCENDEECMQSLSSARVHDERIFLANQNRTQHELMRENVMALILKMEWILRRFEKKITAERCSCGDKFCHEKQHVVSNEHFEWPAGRPVGPEGRAEIFFAMNSP
jgi:hypothetical protein